MDKELPPYQFIDILLGNDKKATKPLIRGFCVENPSTGSTLVDTLDEARALVDARKGKEKYPSYITAVWIHHEGSRKFRSPRLSGIVI